MHTLLTFVLRALGVFHNELWWFNFFIFILLLIDFFTIVNGRFDTRVNYLTYFTKRYSLNNSKMAQNTYRTRLKRNDSFHIV